MRVLRDNFDETIESTDTTANLAKRKNIKAFMATHCSSGHYVFSVKKCGKEECTVCSAVKLDDFVTLNHLPNPTPMEDGEHYQSFQV